MNKVEDVYGPRFFARRHKLNWRAPHVCSGVIEIMEMKKGQTVVDIGCAIGDLVQGFLDLGMDSYGIEGSIAAKPYLTVEPNRIYFEDIREDLDFIEKTNIPIPCDVVTCFEVAEHLEEEHSLQFVFNLCSMSDQIVMSAAPPGQGGHGHVNCQPYEYWERLFHVCGHARRKDLESRLKFRWKTWRSKPGIKAFYQNLLIFKRTIKVGASNENI